MTLQSHFDSSILIITLEEAMAEMDIIIGEMAPSKDGKSLKDFTGGYLQQLKNSTQFVAYFGTKPDSNNRSTTKARIEDSEIDEYYLMLKAKIQDMKSNGATVAMPKSLAQRKLDRAKAKEPAPTKNIFGD